MCERERERERERVLMREAGRQEGRKYNRDILIMQLRNMIVIICQEYGQRNDVNILILSYFTNLAQCL